MERRRRHEECKEEECEVLVGGRCRERRAKKGRSGGRELWEGIRKWMRRREVLVVTAVVAAVLGVWLNWLMGSR